MLGRQGRHVDGDGDCGIAKVVAYNCQLASSEIRSSVDS